MRQFIRGERARLSELAAINHIWQVGVAIDAPLFVMDFCCLGLDEAGHVVDDRFLISYSAPDAPGDAIRMDNASNNGALFTLQLSRVPVGVRRLVFTATLQESLAPGGLFGAAFSLFGGASEIGDGHLTLRTPAVDAAIFRFSGRDFGDQSTLILGELYWRDEWRFVAAGSALHGELDAFLRKLTDGPTPVPVVVPALPKAAPITVPPRPARPTTPLPSPSPKPAAPVVLPAAPKTPVAAQTARTVAPPPAPTPNPRATIQPVAASVAAPAKLQPRIPKAVAPPVVPIDAALLPKSVPPGGHLQDLIDAAAPNSILTLQSDEYQGPITISKPLILNGRDSALWAKFGPVVTIQAPNVTLRDFDIEVTVAREASDPTNVALKIEDVAALVKLENVRVNGHIDGLGDEDGEWILPVRLDLGAFAPRADNEFHFSLSVPTTVQLSSPVEGVALSPAEVGAGQHQITLRVRDVMPDTLIVGWVEVRSAWLSRTIPLNGSATVGETAKTNVAL